MVFRGRFLVVLVLIFVFIGLAGTAFADMLPSTEPCWVKGTAVSSDINLSGVYLDAYLGSEKLGNQLLDSTGVFSLNSIGANTGDTISIVVQGVTFKDFNFAGYCKDANGNPWVNLGDINISKQADGVACSGDGTICSSGNCSSNVCTTPNTGGTNNSTGGSPSGSGTSGTTGTTTTTPEATTTSYTSNNFVSYTEIPSLLAGTGLDSNTIQDFVEAAKNDQLTSTLSVAVEKTGSGSSATFKSTFTITLVNNSGRVINNIKVVQVVPKNIAQSASEITSLSQFRVLIADPVIEFSVPSLNGGQTATLSYSVEKQVTEEQFNGVSNPLAKGAVAASNPPATEPTNNNVPTQGNEAQGFSTSVPPSPVDPVLIVVVALIVIVIVIAVVFYPKQGKGHNNLKWGRR